VPLSPQHNLTDVVKRDRPQDPRSWHRSKPFQRCKLKSQACAKHELKACKTVGVFYNSRNLRDLHFRAVKLYN
jgi:hypothetical protein